MDTLYYAIIIIAILLILVIFVAFSLIRNKSQNDEYEYESELEKSAKKEIESEIKKVKLSFMTLIVTGIAVLLGKLWNWWFTPKKVTITGVLLFLTGVIFSYLLLTTKRGEFAVNVRTGIDIFPPENLELITLSFEAIEFLDSAGNYKPINNVEYKRIDIDEPQQKAIVPTNKYGIAYFKYKARGIDENKLMFKVKIIATTSDFETKYFLDSFFIKASEYDNSLPVIKLRKKRERVQGSMPFKVDIKNTLKEMRATENPSNKFSLRIYPTTAENKNEQIGLFYLMKANDSLNQENFEWDGSAYIIKDLEYSSNYRINYNIYDSSKIKLEILPEDPRIEVKINDGKTLTVSKNAGGNLSQPPVFEKYKPTKSQGVQYQIILSLNYHPNIESLSNRTIEYSLKSSNDEFTENVTGIVPDNGIIIYPANPIEDVNRFWDLAKNLILELKFNIKEFRYKIVEYKDSKVDTTFKNQKIRKNQNKSKAIVINKDNFNSNNEIKINYEINFLEKNDNVALPKIIR